MSKTIFISSQKQFESLLSSSQVVVTDFYADWCRPCKTIAPLYEQLSSQLSRPQKVAFTKVNVDSQPEIARKYGVTAMPTFIVFKSATPVETIRGADPNKLKPIIRKIAQEADMSDDGAEGGSGGFGDVSPSQTWLGASLPRGYKDVTEQVDVKGLDLLNADSELGGARDLFEAKRPAGLNKGKQGDDSGGKGGAKKDWVESDTDQQLMLFVPFHSSLKIHSLHVTSLAEADGDEVMRPKTIRLFTNRAHTLGFDEAESVEPTQSVELRPGDWDANTGTARVELRFVKFQNVSSLVVFVADGQGTGERTRIDRFRIVGEAGDKREMGKLEKIGEGGGE